MTIKTFGSVDERSLKQLERCMTAGDAEYGVLCADHHPGYSQPIGGAVAYEVHVSPSGVGYDIGCGNKAVRTELTRADLDRLGGVRRVMDDLEGVASDEATVSLFSTVHGAGRVMSRTQRPAVCDAASAGRAATATAIGCSSPETMTPPAHGPCAPARRHRRRARRLLHLRGREP